MGCYICLKKVMKNKKKLECNHAFCRLCILKWVRAKFTNGAVNCPVCRREISKFIFTDLRRLKMIKEINEDLEFFSKDQEYKINIIRKNLTKDYLEEIQVFSPLLFLYITKKKQFDKVYGIIKDIMHVKKNFVIEKEIGYHEYKENISPPPPSPLLAYNESLYNTDPFLDDIQSYSSGGNIFFL